MSLGIAERPFSKMGLMTIQNTQQRRWVCPTCGKGVNGPQRPRRDDVRRYCLACSQKSGRLVERVAPSLERQRQQTRERAAAKRATTRERESASFIAKHTVGDVDLVAEAQRLWRLPVVRSQTWWRTRLPKIEIRRSARKVGSSGRCWPSEQRIVVTVGSDPHDALATLLHELIHACLPPGTAHGDPFYRVLRSAAREAWPTIDFRFNEEVRDAGWAWQRRIARGLRTAA